MKTILTPTDFSNASKVAVWYAVNLAMEIDANVILLSVINSNPSSHTLMNWRRLEEEITRTSIDDANNLMAEIAAKTGGKAKITYQSATGFPIENVIEDFAVKNSVDLIVMGTKGATGLKKILIGSNAASVIDNSSIPVITVPAEATYTGVKTMVYASDMVNLKKEIKTVGYFAKLLKAKVQVLYVTHDSNEKLRKELELELTQIAMYPEIHLNISQGENIVFAVSAFVTDHHAELLVMFTHRLDFYEKLFGKGLTQQFAFHGTVPLLAFNKTNEHVVSAKA